MNQQNVGSERGAPFAEGGVAAKSHEVADHLKEALVDQADQVRERAESAKEHAAERIRRVASELRKAGETLRADDTIAANVADRASRRIDGLARYVSESDAQSLVRDTEQLARREPALFFGGAFLLGLAVGRFFKSSRPDAGTRATGEPYRSPARQGQAGARDEWTSSYVVEERGSTSNPERFRGNYDATFARDEPQGPPRPGSTSAMPGGTDDKAAARRRDKNGGGQPGKSGGGQAKGRTP